MRELKGHSPLVSLHRQALRRLRGIWIRQAHNSDDTEVIQNLKDAILVCLFGQMLPPNTHQDVPKKTAWSLVQGFYVVMGGYAIDLNDAEEPFLPESLKRVTITPSGFRFLARIEPDHIPHISEEEIRDKGKANSLAKTVVCFQACWFCIQCIFRLAQKYPISLLELNVFGHAVCTMLIYLLWWDKPLDVDEPTLITGEHMYPICAMMCFTNGDLGPLGYPWRKAHVRDNLYRVKFEAVPSQPEYIEALPQSGQTEHPSK